MSDSVSADPRIGTELAGYRIERLLGRGGMSVVYLAEDTRLERKVALKLLAPELSEDERFRERFLRESKLAASLDHPNVIPIYEAGDHDGTLFIAMRFVEGSDLKRLLAEEGRLEPARAVGILERVADALDAAHKRGLVHRDVKPGNVLISEDDHVYLSDFGLTKQQASESGVTETGQFMGTADYVSPEQIERREVSAATDEYSLACVLYECLTGAPPFRGESLMGTLFGHVNDEAAPASEANPELPGEIDAVLDRGMAKEPGERYVASADLVAAARSALAISGEPLDATTADGRGGRRRLLVAALVVIGLAVVAVVLAVVLTGGGDEGSPVESVAADSVMGVSAETDEVVAVVPVGRNPSAIAVGNDWVLVSNRGEGTVSIVSPESGSLPRTLSVGGTPLAVAIDGDTGWVTSVSDGQGVLSELDLGSGRVRREMEDLGRVDPVAVTVGEGAVWVGVQDQFQLAGAILRVDPASLEIVATIPTPGDKPFEIVAAHGATWFTNIGFGESAAVVSRIDPDTNQVVATVPLPTDTGDIRTRLAAGPEALWAADTPWGNEIWRIDPAVNGVTETVTLDTNGGLGCLAFADGSLWVTVGETELWRIDPETEETISRFGFDQTKPSALAASHVALWAGYASPQGRGCQNTA